MYVLQTDGDLGHLQNGSLSSLQTNVSSFQLDPNGTVVARLPYGALESWTSAGSGWSLVAGNVSSYQVAPNETLYFLQPGGSLSVWQNGSLTLLKSAVSSFEIGPNGILYAQLPYGALESWTPNGGWTLAASNVS